MYHYQVLGPATQVIGSQDLNNENVLDLDHGLVSIFQIIRYSNFFRTSRHLTYYSDPKCL